MKELEEEFSNVDPKKPSPTRYTISEQAKMATAPPVQEASEETADGMLYVLFDFHWAFTAV